jgi:ribosomal protein S18 acetylase RimI-like enzyme
MPQSVEPFNSAHHSREGFSSGVASVDNYLKLTARKLSDASAAAVFVVADPDGTIVGFYALTSLSVDASDIGTAKANKLFGRFNAVPATLIAMMGVDQRFQSQGIGKMLLADALRRSFAASRQVGSFCVVLDVLEDSNSSKRIHLYEGLGFRRCDTVKGLRMYLTMADIEAASES